MGCLGRRTACVLAASILSTAGAARAQTAGDLSRLSLEELANVPVTSVSKREEALGEAPSAIFVISHDDILRTGAATLPEILRLAPNLQVAQAGASRYVITARGFNGSSAAQSFSNKLLVLIDGRSVYSPLFSGLYWDMQDVLPADIDRIEVISGPGATLWGANAVNGVINIITRRAADTQGGLVELQGGGLERQVSLRYGGRLGENLDWRVYARGLDGDAARTIAGASAQDGWTRGQGGFRMDWNGQGADRLTLQGDLFRVSQDQPGGGGDAKASGRNLLARWSHMGADGGELQVQAYYDHVRRGGDNGGGAFAVDTYDLSVQRDFDLGGRHRIVLGGDLRSSRYRIDGLPQFYFVPASARLDLASLFAQDTIALSPGLSLTLGLKFEDDPYVDGEWLPNARLAWTPSQTVTLWAAASRAIRSPTPFDRDVVEKLGGRIFLIGDARFTHEKLTAYEVGARLRPTANLSFSVSAFLNDYDDLRSIEFSPGPALPLQWGNLMDGQTYGLEAWGDWQARPGWRLSAGLSTLTKDLSFKPGSSRLLGVAQAGDDPRYQASLRSDIDLSPVLALDTRLRRVGALPDPHVPAYTELDASLVWNLTSAATLAVSGRNLLHDRHLEVAGAAEAPRSLSVDLLWRF